MSEVLERPATTQAAVRKAYMVRSGDDEGNCTIVFGKGNAEARRLGADHFDITFEQVESCTRAPEFDVYAAAAEVPPLVLIDHGWWFECDHCGRQVSSDSTDEDDNPLQPVADGDRVYCNTAHQMAEWQVRRLHEARDAAAIEACALRFHGLPISNLRGSNHCQYGKRDTVQCCDFDFPGRTGLLARWDIGDTHVWLSECDKPTWEALCDAHFPEQKPQVAA